MFFGGGCYARSTGSNVRWFRLALWGLRKTRRSCSHATTPWVASPFAAQRKCRAVFGGDPAESASRGPGPTPDRGCSGLNRQRAIESGRGQLENSSVAVKSHLTYMNLTKPVQTTVKTPLGFFKPGDLCNDGPISSPHFSGGHLNRIKKDAASYCPAPSRTRQG